MRQVLLHAGSTLVVCGAMDEVRVFKVPECGEHKDNFVCEHILYALVNPQEEFLPHVEILPVQLPHGSKVRPVELCEDCDRTYHGCGCALVGRAAPGFAKLPTLPLYEVALLFAPFSM